jgi:hypothetical protein
MSEANSARGVVPGLIQLTGSFPQTSVMIIEWRAPSVNGWKLN